MKRSADRFAVSVSFALLALLLLFTVLMPGETEHALESARIAVCDVLGVWFLALVIACIVFSCWAAFGKYGHIRMGHEKPEYGNFA